MSWQGLKGHDPIFEAFRLSISRGRLASSYLFVGPQGVGKRSFALRLAQSLLCREVPAGELAPCDRCESCQQVLAGTHPDIDTVSAPAGKKVIPVRLLIGDHEHRSRAGFCHNLAMKPFHGGRKIGIVDDADCLNQEGANCLLKTLEEPPPRSLLILIGTSPDRQLPTIRSRCQIVRFSPLSVAELTDLLLAHGQITDRSVAQRLAGLSDGGLRSALDLADEDLWQFRQQLRSQLSEPELDSVRMGLAVRAFVDQAEQSTAQRRLRITQVVRMAEDFYRERLKSAVGMVSTGLSTDDDIDPTASADETDVTAILAAIDRCLAALQHIDRNANLATLIECWADDLSRCQCVI